MSAVGERTNVRVRCALTCSGLLALVGSLMLAAEAQVPPLAGPVPHWLFERPIETQTRIISIRLRAVDLDGNALPAGTCLQAHCAPWDYTVTRLLTDPGEVSFRGPAGDWTFLVAADRGTGAAVLSGRGPVKLLEDARLEIAPEREIELQYLQREAGRGRMGRPRLQPQRSGSLSLVTSDFPCPASALPLGRLGDAGLRLQVTNGIRGHLWLVDTPEPDRPGYALFSRYAAGASDAAVFSPADLGQLVLAFAGYRTPDVWADMYLTPAGADFTEQAAARVLFHLPPDGATYRLNMTPGRYRLYVILSQDLKQACACLGYYLLDIRPGQHCALPFGNRFAARPQVCQWDDAHLHLWFDVDDDRGNSLLFYNQPTSLWLGKDGTELYRGSSSAPLGERWYEVDRPWGTPADRAGVAYRFGTTCPLFGELTASGELNADEVSLERLPEIAGSDHFTVRCRDDAPEAAQLVADTLEGAYAWTAGQYAGPIRTAQGQPFDVCGVTRTGMQWASNNDRIGLPVSMAQLPYDLTGDCLRALLHEFGHLYEANAPHHLAPQLTDYRMANGGSLENESQATLTADLCLRATRGETAYHWARQRDSVLFFDWKGGRADCPDEHDRYLFMYHYLGDVYGQQLHRDYMCALHGTEGAWVEAMLADPSLRTIHDRMAVIYSFLSGDNLAWLWRWAEFPVADQAVQDALTRLKAAGFAPPQP